MTKCDEHVRLKKEINFFSHFQTPEHKSYIGRFVMHKWQDLKTDFLKKLFKQVTKISYMSETTFSGNNPQLLKLTNSFISFLNLDLFTN